MIDLIPAFIYAKDAHSRFTAANKLVANRMGVEPADLIGKTDFDFFPREHAEKFFADEQALIQSGVPLIDREEIAFDKTRGKDRVILTSKIPLRDAAGNLTGIVGTGFDITDRKDAEERMASSDRLESIGRLAAGVAHEINTPIQYLSDSVTFIRDGVGELLAYIDELHKATDVRPATGEDVEYMREELPPALARVAEGLSRITEIVRSMKDFSHADQREMGEVDLNRAINSTLVVARSEYRDVADVETDLGEIPRVTCHGGQINQVVLNLVVNAAHAIGDVIKKGGTRGQITVRTRDENDTWSSRSRIRAAAFPKRFARASSTRSSRPRKWAAARARGSRCRATWWSRAMVANSTSPPRLGKGTTFFVRLPIAGAPSTSSS